MTGRRLQAGSDVESGNGKEGKTKREKDRQKKIEREGPAAENS